jgi:hypothetical protein
MGEVKIKISRYLAAHLYLSLGTVTTDSSLQVHTVGYVSEGCKVFFITDRKSCKAKNISANLDLIIFKLEPAKGYFLDNTIALDHRYSTEL